MRYFIELSYFGKPYHGWQKQPNAVTVQQTLEEALTTLLREPIKIMGAGRTDTGVHASQMYAHADIEEIAFAKAGSGQFYDKENLNYIKTFTHKLNNFLPRSIAIQSIFPVAENAHTRFDATARTYRYRISKNKNPFTAEASYYCKYNLDLDAMKEASAILLEYNDFECFSKSKTEVNNYLCTLTEARWEEREGELHFVITANRFLRNMVRAIVGTLIIIGREKQLPQWMHQVIKEKNRSIAGASAPAHGLYLERVKYPSGIIKNYGRD